MRPSPYLTPLVPAAINMNKKKRELEKNELADAVTAHLENLKPHMTRIILIGCAVILGILAVAFWINSSRTIRESRWREYFTSSRFADPRAMDTVAELYPNTTPGHFALIGAADADSIEAFSNLASSREAYNEKLKKAAERYEQIVESTSEVNPFARLRATYALAYTYESLGRFKRAEKLYQQIIDDAGETPEGELAASALVRITNPKMTAIYTAFEAWEPPPSTAPGRPGGLPPRPDISFGEEAESTAADDATPDDAASPDDQPADDETDDVADPSGGDDDSATDPAAGDGNSPRP